MAQMVKAPVAKPEDLRSILGTQDWCKERTYFYRLSSYRHMHTVAWKHVHTLTRERACAHTHRENFRK